MQSPTLAFKDALPFKEVCFTIRINSESARESYLLIKELAVCLPISPRGKILTKIWIALAVRYCFESK